MNVLIVVATRIEAHQIITHFGLDEISANCFTNSDNSLTVLITGIGSQLSILNLSFYLSKHKPDLIFNAGIAGAFDSLYRILDTFIVKSDYFGDIGFFRNNLFVNLFNSKYCDKTNASLFDNGKVLINTNIPKDLDFLPKVDAVTVNIPENINSHDNVILETMEGAAVMLCAKYYNIPCLQIRSVSNIIELTNRKDWKIDEAIEKYSSIIINYLKTIV